VARTGRPRVPYRPILVCPIFSSPACCRSSVVEHSLGKGEVDSSILSGSTSYATKSIYLRVSHLAKPECMVTCTQNEARKCVQLRAESARSGCSNWVLVSRYVPMVEWYWPLSIGGSSAAQVHQPSENASKPKKPIIVIPKRNRSVVSMAAIPVAAIPLSDTVPALVRCWTAGSQ
jgi:hypothetical protein